MPRIIHIPLSGRDRRFTAQQLRAARDAYASKTREAGDARAAEERYRQQADRAECEAWHAAMFAGGPGAAIAHHRDRATRRLRRA